MKRAVMREKMSGKLHVKNFQAAEENTRNVSTSSAHFPNQLRVKYDLLSSYKQ